MNVSVIGIGSMGQPMAANLVKAGHNVTTYSRSQSRSVAGAHAASDFKQVCSSEVVITMLSDDRALTEVVWGEDGLNRLMPKDSLHISMETISPAVSELLVSLHKKAGRAYVAAPVVGRPEAAAAARLFILAAGAPQSLERANPLFAAMGQRTFVIGDNPAMAHSAKLGVNFLIASAIEAMSEAIALMRKSGLDAANFLEVITSTIFSAPVYNTYGKLIVEEKYQPAGFRLPLGLKDVRLVLEASEAAKAPMPIASVIRDNMIDALAHGQENLDWSSVARVAARRAGLEG